MPTHPTGRSGSFVQGLAREATIYGERPPDGVCVLLKLILWLALFSSLMRADISWEEQSMPGKMVGPEEPQV